MKSLTTALKAHYASGTTTLATCWKATLTNGTVYAATSLDRDVVFAGVTYQAASSYKPSNVDSSLDLNPDNLELDGYLSASFITNGDIQAGLWDYAAIELFETNYLDPSMGRNLIRSGTLGQVKTGRQTFNTELRGLMQAYSRVIGRLTTQTCTADLGDARCTKVLTAFTFNGTVGSATANRVIVDSSRTQPDNYFTGGKLSFTSGANNGLSMEVQSYSVGVLTLALSLPYIVAAGDTYSVIAGCTKRFSEDCVAKFANGVNFRGFPHVPGVSIWKAGGVV
jgi:uncharacterized phage protein (TIGR02218 family)